jgi:hypothetical protein
MAPPVREYPKLPPQLKSQLDLVTPSMLGNLKFYPCLVRLNNGTEVDRVYFVSQAQCTSPGTDEIRVEDVASLRESPSRLPTRFAKELYEAGESGMAQWSSRSSSPGASVFFPAAETL